MTDVQLHSRFRAGEETAVRDVYERHGGAMFATAMSVLGNATSPPTPCSKPSSRPGASSRTFDPGRVLRPWLATITRRAAIDVYRRELTARRSAAGTDQDATVIPVAFERTWEAFEVRSALEQLPPDEREVMRLSHFEGLADPEIAEKLGVPVGTVKSRSHRAHRRLASLLSHLVESAS